MHINTHPIPDTGFLRLPAVLQLIPIGKSSWWEGVKKGTYPQPIKISRRVTAWRAEDIRALIEKLSQK
jgi:predicted DNA-binding transcriptional regulator AlpA